MAITEVVRLDIQTQQAQANMEGLSATINEQKLITIELERELKRLEQALRDTPKTAMAAQRDLNQQINHVKDSISDQRLSLKELQVQQSQTQGISKYTDKQKGLGDAMKITSEETTGLNSVTGGYASQLRNMQLMMGFAQKKAVAFAGSLKAVQGALIATGIGALVVALGAIVAYWDEIVDFITQAEKKQREYTESLEGTKTLLKSNLTLINKQIELEEELGGAAEDLKIEKRKILNEIIETNAKLIAQLKIQDELEKTVTVQETKWNAIKRNLGASIPMLAFLYDTGSGMEEQKKTQNERQIRINELETESLNTQIQLLTLDKQKNKEKRKGLDLDKLLENQSKKELAERQKLLEEIEKIENEFLDKNKEKQVLEEQAVREKYFRLIELARQHTDDLTILEAARDAELKEIRDAAEQERLDSIKEFREQFEEFGEPSIDELREQAIAELELLKTNEIEKREALAEINAYYDKLEEDARKDKEAIEKSDAQAILDFKLKMARQALSIVVDAIGKQSAVGKAAAVAMATIDTFQSAQSAYAAAMQLGPAGIALAPIAAGIAVVAGLANVKKILSTKTPGGGGGGGSVPSATRPPSFNMIGDRGGVSDVQSGIDNGEQTPPKAYVVGGDVTTQQELDRNAVNASGF